MRCPDCGRTNDNPTVIGMDNTYDFDCDNDEFHNEDAVNAAFRAKRATREQSPAQSAEKDGSQHPENPGHMVDTAGSEDNDDRTR